MPEETKTVDVTDLPSAHHLALRIRDGWRITAIAQIPGGLQFKLRQTSAPADGPSATPAAAEPQKPPIARLTKLRPKGRS